MKKLGERVKKAGGESEKSWGRKWKKLGEKVFKKAGEKVEASWKLEKKAGSWKRK